MKNRRVLFTGQKDEGKYVLEWIAYHKTIGFTDFVFFSNDCTDGSYELLSALQKLGHCQHSIHNPTNLTPQHNAAKLAYDGGTFEDGDWVMWMDLDEYLFINIGDHKLESLIQAIEGRDMIYIAWKLFGDNHNETWPGRHITDKLVGCQEFDETLEPAGKSLFKWSDKIERFSAHRPWVKPGVSRDEFDAISSAGTRPTPFFGVKRGIKFNRLLNGGQYWNLAQVNHYAVRTPDMYIEKAKRGAGNPRQSKVRNKYKDSFYRQYNRNESEDRKILIFRDQVDAEIVALKEDLATLNNNKIAKFIT
jgi:hypothetical protein